MRSIKELPKRLSFYYGKSFTIRAYSISAYSRNNPTVFTITKIPDSYKPIFSDEIHCWIDGCGNIKWDNCINNINKGIWVII